MLAPAPRRIVALDYGRQRVGIALSDPLRLFAQPQGARSPAEAVAFLRQIAAAEGLEALVVGWPLDADGQEGPATERVAQFIRRLQQALPGVPVVRWDERYTSAMARERLREAGVRHTRAHRGRVDAQAAAIILQEYLDAAPR